MTILVCQCGARLNAPGATPGRVGRCPACGSALKVPEPSPRRAERSDDRSRPEGVPPTGPLAPHTADRQPPATDFSGLTAESDNGTPAVFRRHRVGRRKSKPSLVDKIDTRHGLVSRPDRPEKALWGSLVYPFWDTTGLLFLVIFSILWWCLLFVPFSFVVDGVAPSGPVWALILPTMLGPLLLFGYTLLYLGDVLVSSAAGEIRHPRWPSGDPGEIIRGLSRWFWAFLIGASLGMFPAVWYWIRCGQLDLLDWFVLVDLILPGVAYGQMALVASLLFDDPLGANPVTVCLALWRVGIASLRPGLVVSAAIILAGGLSIPLVAITIPILAFFSLWLFLVLILYEALVVMRVLGLEYRRQASKIGWFRHGPRRSV